MCSLLPTSTGLGSCDPSWHRVTFLPPSSVPEIQPALPAARLSAQLEGREVNFPHQAVQSTQAMQSSASAGRRLCSWTPPPFSLTLYCVTAGPGPPLQSLRDRMFIPPSPSRLCPSFSSYSSLFHLPTEKPCKQSLSPPRKLPEWPRPSLDS